MPLFPFLDPPLLVHDENEISAILNLFTPSDPCGTSKIILFLCFLINLRVKSSFTKIIEDNIFEEMEYQFNILLLFDFVLFCYIFLKQYLDKYIFHSFILSKICFSIVFIMGAFTLRLLKYIKKKFSVNAFCLYVALGPERENQWIDILLSLLSI